MNDGADAARPDFYKVGGALSPAEPSYVERVADAELLDAVLHRHYCYVLTARQMGKSSLMVSCAEKIRQRGILSAIIDLTSIGATDITAEAWYLGQISRIAQQLPLRVNCIDWWQSRANLHVVQRFTDFLSELARAAPKPVVVFIDEIDTTLSLPGYGADYFGAIRSLYNQRATDARLERLSFVLLGVAAPSDLIPDAQRTPFNVGTRIQLTDFTLTEASILAPALASDRAVVEELLRQVLVWTNGHPYLTQKVCSAIAQRLAAGEVLASITTFAAKVVWDLFLSEASRNTDGNLQFVRHWIQGTDASSRALELYRSIRAGTVVVDNELDPLHMRLKLSGLVKPADGGRLRVRNAIYERIFDNDWVGNALAEIRRRGTVPTAVDSRTPGMRGPEERPVSSRSGFPQAIVSRRGLLLALAFMAGAVALGFWLRTQYARPGSTGSSPTPGLVLLPSTPATPMVLASVAPPPSVTPSPVATVGFHDTPPRVASRTAASAAALTPMVVTTPSSPQPSQAQPTPVPAPTSSMVAAPAATVTGTDATRDVLASPADYPTPEAVSGPAKLTAVSPFKVRGDRPALLDIHGEGLRPDHRAVLLQGEARVAGFLLINQRYTSPRLIMCLVRFDGVSPGRYSLALADGTGATTNRLRLEVTP